MATAIPAEPKAEPAVAERPRLKPQNEAKFEVLQNVEAVGGSRSYSGGQSDPDSCAEQCLANSGCDAFSFEREAKLCILVRHVTDMTANQSFFSGKLR